MVDFDKLGHAVVKTDEDETERPSVPPSRQASFWDMVNRVLYFTSIDMQWIPVNFAYSTDVFTDPPTKAELVSAFGDPATIGSQFTAIINNGGTDTNVYLVITTGAEYYYFQLTKAV